MWLSLTNSILFLVFFAVGCFFSYRHGYVNGLNANLVFRVMEAEGMIEDDEDYH